jgi:hypothetical protein
MNISWRSMLQDLVLGGAFDRSLVLSAHHTNRHDVGLTADWELTVPGPAGVTAA